MPIPADTTQATPEPDAQERALVRRWLKRVSDKRKSKAFKAHCKAVKEGREAVAGRKCENDGYGDTREDSPRTNLLFAKIAAAEQHVYAKNPQIAVTPEEQVEAPDRDDDPEQDAISADPMAQMLRQQEDDAADADKEMLSQFCRTAELLLTRAFVKEGRLKDRAKAAVRRAFTSRLAWAKITYSRDKRTDPLVVNQLKDSQDNIQRLEAQLQRLRNPQRLADTEAELGQLRQLVASLQQKTEVVVNEGIVIDILEPTAIVVLKENRQDFGDYVNAPAIVHTEFYSRDVMEQQFGLSCEDIEKLTKYSRSGEAAAQGDCEFYGVHEIWCQDDQTVYTAADGLDRWLRAPWIPKGQGARWYPFFALGFYLVDGQEYPLSGPELLAKLQADYERMRDDQEHHRSESMPAYFVAGGGLDEADITAIANRKRSELNVLKNWTPGTSFEQVVGRFQPVPMNPAVYDGRTIRGDMELVFGVSDAAGGGVVDPKTATEAQIVQNGFGERVSAFVDTVEDWISEMAHYSLEVLLLELTEDQVKQICGAAAVWPTMNREEIYERVRAQVLAGSTGKPNKRMERETWMQLLPQLMQMMTAYAQMVQAGQQAAARAIKELAKVTARKFDERTDVDRFFPDAPAPQPAPPALAGMPPGMPQDPSAPAMQPGAAPSGAPGMLTAAAAQSADMLPSPQQVQ